MASSHNLIFIHGWGTSPSVWNKQVDFFSKKYRVKTPSLIFPENLFLSTINYKPSTILIGWSYGGMLSIKLASKEPGKFKALVLVGSTAKFADEKNGMSSAVIKKIKKNLERNFEVGMKDCYRTFFSEEASYADEFVNSQTLPDKKSAIDMLDELLTLDLRGVLKEVDIPTLIIHGDKDEVCPLGAAELLHKNLKGSRLEIIKGAGHMPFYTRPDEFNRIVGDFIYDK